MIALQEVHCVGHLPSSSCFLITKEETNVMKPKEMQKENEVVCIDTVVMVAVTVRVMAPLKTICTMQYRFPSPTAACIEKLGTVCTIY